MQLKIVPKIEETIDERYKRLRDKAFDQQNGKSEKIKPTLLFLPGMGEFFRAMPNHIARSSLYAPIAKRERVFHRDTVLVTRSDAQITYTGEQLDEADADLTLQLIFEARSVPLGLPVKLKRSTLLTDMGRATGRTQYQWLHSRMKALTVATLFIEAKNHAGESKFKIGHTEGFHILQRFTYDEEAGIYTFLLDPRWITLFANREFTYINWKKRLQIGRGQDMAKTLQRLVATSSDLVQRYSLEWLKEKMQYAGRMRDFREALIRAMNELERLEIIAASKIEISTKRKEQTVWTRL